MLTEIVTAWKERARRALAVPANVVMLAVSIFLVAAAISVPVDRKGDGSEYILATESLTYDHDLVMVNSKDLFRHIEHRPRGMDTPAGLTLLPGTDGVYRYGFHSFYYPLACVPFFAGFGYHGFFIFNALLLSVAMIAAYAHLARTQSPGRAAALAVGGTFLSAAWSYVFWTQADLFLLALLTLYLFFFFGDRPRTAAVFLGIAVGAQFPLAVLGLPFLGQVLLRRQWLLAAQLVAIVLACAAPQIYYDIHYLGTLSPVAQLGMASTRYISFGVVVRWLFDPAMGMIWFYPIIVYCLVHWEWSVRNVSLLVASIVLLVLMSTTRVVYSHQVGVRYALYAFPIIMFGVREIELTSWRSRVTAVYAIVVGTGLAMNPLGNSHDMDLRTKSFLPYRIADAFGYLRENPEAFRASSDALAPEHVYVRGITVDRWTWGDARAVLMILDAHPGDLELDVRSFAGDDPTYGQRVRIGTLSGANEIAKTLGPSELATFKLSLKAEDIRYYSRWDRTYTFVTVFAEGWSPSELFQGHPPEEHDLRMLGVNLQSVRLDGRPLLNPN